MELVGARRGVKHTVDFGGVVESTASAYGVSAGDVLGRSRKEPIATARLATYYIMYHKHNASTTSIGELMGRDHSTVYTGIKRVGRRIRSDASFREELEYCMGGL